MWMQKHDNSPANAGSHPNEQVFFCPMPENMTADVFKLRPPGNWVQSPLCVGGKSNRGAYMTHLEEKRSKLERQRLEPGRP
jgi:hypothetical protein